MLSISNVANAGAAGSYYEKSDDYYSKERSPSLWWGVAAESLNLHGAVDSEIFKSLLAGTLPNGEHIHRAGTGKRCGTDLTFSAPKSVSLQALIGHDTKLLAAHEAAVSKALKYAESLAACRITENRITAKSKTGNLLVAQFRHDLSRAADPQLHTHCVLLNATQRADGQWRALDNESLYRHKMFLGAYYRSALAREVQALGYQVRVTHSDGRFELAHINPAQINQFSQRSQQIEQQLLALGKTRQQVSAQQLQLIALQTRQVKTEHDREALSARWKTQANEVSIDFKNVGVFQGAIFDAQREASIAITHSVDHLGERDAVLTHLNVIRAALERGVGLTDLEAIEIAVNESVEKGELIRVGDLYTTPAAVEREHEILATELSGRGKASLLVARHEVASMTFGEGLNTEQSEVVKSVILSVDLVMGIQGSAGTGKTTTLRAIKNLAEVYGLKPMGTAPSAGAARELEHAGIKSQTLASLATTKYSGLSKDTLLVVDEAGMVSSRDMLGLLKAARDSQSRVLLVGDVHQLKAIQAGRPFEQLQTNGMKTALLKEIQRQQVPNLKKAVQFAAAGQIHDSFSQLLKIDKSLIEIDSHEDRHSRMATDFFNLPAHLRSNTLMVAGTHRAREAINEKVRKSLGLSGQGQVFVTLSRKDMSQAEALRTVAYQPGDAVRADRDYKSMGMLRGDVAHVVNGPAGVVTLERLDGQKLSWIPVRHPHLSAYVENQREFSIGDIVRVTRNDKNLGLVNGERAMVIELPSQPGLASNRFLLQKNDSSIVSLDSENPLYLEHGYCQTVHAAQGQTCERVLIDVPVISGMSNESSYYVAISRATHQAILYTDDIDSLPNILARPDEKSAALDLIELESPSPEGAALEID